MFCYKTVKLVGKGLAVSAGVGSGASRRYAAVSQLIHHIAHCKPIPDIYTGIQSASGIDDRTAFAYHTVGKGNIICDDKVSGPDNFLDPVVGFIIPGRYDYS